MSALPVIEDWRDNSMSRILHVFPASTFLAPFIEFINTNFPPEDHLFFVMGDKSKYQDICKHSNVITALKSEGKMQKARTVSSLMESNEKTIFHSLFVGGKFLLLLRYLFLTRPSLKSKVYWVIWGGDLYNHFLRKRTRKSDTLNAFKKTVISRFGNIVALVPGDYELAKEWYGAKGRRFSAFYPNPVDFAMLDAAASTKENHSSGMARILLGNSASETNNHFDAIDLLAKRQEQDFEVICPLSYGDLEYANRVIEYGKAKLGEKFRPITDFMKPEEYAGVLAGVDAAIMFHRRQQAVNSIIGLLYLGKKVFLRSEVTTYEWLKSDLGIEVCDADLLYEETHIRFSPHETRLAAENKEIIEEFFSRSNCIRLWKEVFKS